MTIDLKDWGVYQLQGLEWSPEVVSWLIANTRCQGCLGCCDGSHYPAVSLSKRDALRIPKKERRRMTPTPDGSFIMEAPCAFLVDGWCTIHASKPGVCREYPVSFHKESPWVIIVACPAGQELIRACLELKPGLKATLYQT